MESYNIGLISNPDRTQSSVDVPTAVIILGTAAIGAFIGMNFGASGAAIGALVGAFIGGLATVTIKKMRVVLHPSGEVEIEIEYRVRPF